MAIRINVNDWITVFGDPYQIKSIKNGKYYFQDEDFKMWFVYLCEIEAVNGIANPLFLTP